MATAALKELRQLTPALRVEPGSSVTPRKLERRHTGGFKNQEAAAGAMAAGIEVLADFQDRLAAEATRGVLVILQGLDASGKDSTIKHVMSGVNPQGVRVYSFKVPSSEELTHDYLWRYAKNLPRRGEIAIFNRSHYEEVLVVRVHPENLERQRLPPEARAGDLWERRFRAINEWERHLVEDGIRIVKLFLNVSRAEQRRRFLARIDRPRKNWKFSAADVEERHFWDEYQRAYAAVLTHTSTPWAPWFLIPADHKWFTHVAVTAVLVQTLEQIGPHYPRVGKAARAELARARAQLEAEGTASRP